MLKASDGFTTVARKRKRAKLKPNRYAALETETQTKRPPPVILRDSVRWVSAVKLFQERNIAFLKAKSVVDGVFIQPTRKDDFRKITKEFNRLGYPYHTYRLQSEKVLSVIIRELIVEEPLEPTHAKS